MPRLKVDKPSLKERILIKLNLFILQLIASLTFIGILPVLILLFASVSKGMYLDSIFLCGVLLTLIKANKMIQG